MDTLPKLRRNAGNVTTQRQSTLPSDAQAWDIAQAIAWLCTMKQTLKLTPTEVGVWGRTLGAFESWIVFRAILRVGLSREAFISLGDVASECRDISAEHLRYGVASFPGSLRRIAEQFGAVIDPPPQEKPNAIGQRTLSRTKAAFREAAARLRRKREAALSEFRPAAIVEPEPLPDSGARLSPEARDQLIQAMNNAAAKRRRIL